ncbi:hypothetical protein [Halostella litorea]|uniref:hypothetical protein n=1 Tax=Halostella litorea TaxID=2528831 RepID=UPI0010920456|nr:hypothetical protein [Halostella litorea]
MGRLASGFAAGVVATVWKTTAAIAGRRQGLTALPAPFPLALVRRLLGGRAPRTVEYPAAAVAHLGYGGTMGALFAALSPRGDGGTARATARGAAWGALLWLVQQLVFFPVVGWGRFGRDLSRAAAAETLFHHLVYGAVLGAVTPAGRGGR